MANVVLNAGDYTRINSQLFVSGTIHEESGYIRLTTPSSSVYSQNTALELNSELSSIVGCVQTNDYWGIRGWYYGNGSGVNHGYVEIATNTSNDTSLAGEIRCAQYTGGTPVDGTGANRATAWILDANSNTVFPNQVWGGDFTSIPQERRKRTSNSLNSMLKLCF